MNSLFVTVAFFLFSVFVFASSSPSDFPEVKTTHDGFIPNMGQLRDASGRAAKNVLLATESNGQQLFITTQGFTYVFSNNKTIANDLVVQHKWRVNMTLSGATIRQSDVEWIEQIDETQYNFYYPHCAQGITNVHAYRALRVRNVYPGVDWYIEKSESGLKYNFELQPGADPAQIKIVYTGANKLTLDENGNVIVTTPFGQIKEEAPTSFQNGHEISTHFVVNDSTLAFHVNSYNNQQPLTIDPTLVWGTVFGGFFKDEFRSLTYDHSGHLYATGYTESLDFPVVNAGTYYTDTITGPQNTLRTDVVIVKFNTNNSLQWATYYGGSNINGLECGYAALVDQSDNLFIAGVTISDDFPVQNAGTYFDASLDGTSDGFLIKFNPTGQRLYATLFGGNSEDYIYDLCVDGASNIYACGYTSSTTFPVLQSGASYYQTAGAYSNGFVTKFANDGNLVWSTLLGGANFDEARSITSDGVNVFVCGFTNSLDFPVNDAGTFFQASLNGGTGGTQRDAFISKFDVGGTLAWSTYYGGAANDFGMSAEATPSGDLYVLGSTKSFDFPVQSYNAAAYFDAQLNSGDTVHYDACFLKFQNNGTRLWSTYYGGSEDEVRLSFRLMPYMNDLLRTDACGNVYGAFISRSSNAPVQNPLCNSYFNPTRGGDQDAMLVKFTRQQKLHWSTFYGNSSDEENGLSIAINRNGNVSVVGNTDEAVGTPVLLLPGGGYYSISIDSTDAFFGMFKQPKFTTAITTSLCAGPCSGAASAVINSACSAPGYSFQWSNGASESSVSSLCTGSYTVTITDTTNCFIDTAVAVIASGISIEPTVDAVSCDFACTGLASVTVPGASSLTYAWSNGSTDAFVAGLCPGNYAVTVTAPGCGADAASFSIVLPPTLIINLASVNATCGASCTSGASVVITGGETLPVITWSNGDIGPSADGLCAGQFYTITASDSLCYTATYNLYIPITEMTADVETVTGCACDNSLSIEVDNATDYTVLWSTTDTTETITGLCPGNYTVTVTDVNCGTLSITTTVSPVPTPSLLPHCYFEGCPDSCNVWCTIKVFPDDYAFPGVSVDWTDTAGNPISHMCVGSTYNYVWTDACGDTITGSVTPYPNYYLTAQISVLDYTCPGTCEGVMGIDTILGGAPPYSESWSNGFFGFTSYNLCVGDSEILTITDGCDITVNIPFVFPQASHVEVNTGYSPACATSCNGTAYGFYYDGVDPYTYVWNTGDTTDQVLNACANTWYYVTVTDACDTIDTDSVLVQLAPPQTNSIVHSSSVCAMQCNGTATVLSSGGTPPFFYTWSNGSAGQQVFNLCPLDSYTVVIYDPGCSLDTVTFSIPINQVEIQIDAAVDNDCYYDCNGSIDVHVNGGSPPFGYSWSNGATVEDIDGLCQDTYVFVVYDPACSVDSATVVLNGPGPTQATAEVLDTLNCFYDCQASAVVHITGGVAPFDVLWSNGSIDTLTNTLCHGSNYVIVDDPGCWSDTLFVDIVSSSYLQMEASLVASALCYDSCDGIAGVVAADGVLPYGYNWTSGETQDTANQLCAGISYVTVTDALGCVAVDTVFVPQPTAVYLLNDVTPSHCENPDGNIVATVGGGTPGYSYLWSTGSTEAQTNLLTPGTYFVTVVDANGCVLMDSASFAGLYPEITTNADTTVLYGNGTELWVQGAQDYLWSPNVALNCDTCPASLALPLVATTYCVVGTDEYGCMDTACVTVLVSTDCGAAEFPNAFTPNDDGLNDVFRVHGRCFDEYHLVVYNRWGQKVFESFDPLIGWDGMFDGEDADMGVYSFYADVLNLLGEHTVKQGNVTLIR